LGLNLSETKTLITNADKERALFLGTRIGRAKHQTIRHTHGFPSRNSREIRLEAPMDRVLKKLATAGFLKGNHPIPKFVWNRNEKDEIITLYNSVYRGFTNYYSFAANLNKLSSWIHFSLKSSCAKLLAAKFSLGTCANVYKTFGKDLKGKDKASFIDAKYGVNTRNFKGSATDHIKAPPPLSPREGGCIPSPSLPPLRTT
jgi:hypothetical protein